MHFEPLTPERAPACAAIFAAARPEAAWSTAHIAALAGEEPPARHLLAVGEDGRVLAFASLTPDLERPGPERYGLELMVAPEDRSRGVGRALAAAVLDGLAPRSLMVCARTDHPYAETWILAEGFREHRRHLFVSRRLDEPLPEPGAPAPGVEVASLADRLAREGEAEVHARLLELLQDFTRDIPGAEDAAREATVATLAKNLADPSIDPQLYMIAAAEGRYVAKCDLRRRDDPSLLDTGSTGVARAWRRKGLARHLKLVGLHQARARGAVEVMTANDEANAAMRALNAELGFRLDIELRTYVRATSN